MIYGGRAVAAGINKLTSWAADFNQLPCMLLNWLKLEEKNNTKKYLKNIY